ncbi:TERT gene, partial [Plasmodium yoelii yoelii]
MLIIINPNKNVKDFYKLLFKNKNKNNYIFKLFMNNIKEKSIEEKYENDNINLQESSESSDSSYRNEQKKTYDHINKNISYLNTKELINFEILKKRKEKYRKYISTIRKNLFINSNNEVTDTHSDNLKKFATLFNISLEIGKEKYTISNSDSINSDIDENYINYIEKKKKWDNIHINNTQNDSYRSNSVESKQISYEQLKNMHNNRKIVISECKNKLLFIHGEKYSNQYVVNNYILKHIIKDENNKELYYSYKNIMSILNLFFVNKCFNFIIYKCVNNKIIYFNIVPCFLSEENNNVTNICTKINEFYNQLIDSEKKTNSQKKVAKQMETKEKKKSNHNNETTHSPSDKESNGNGTSIDNNNNIKEKIIDLRKIINIPHIFFFLLKCILNNNNHRFFKDLKLHTLDIKKICRNYIDIPYIKLNSFDADKLFSSFLKIGFSEEDIININKIIFAILFINIYIRIRNCLILNEQKALNQLQIQLIQVQDYIKLRKLHINNNENMKGKNTQLNLNKFLNFNYKNYVNSEQSPHSEYGNNNISKNKNSEKKIKSNYFIVFVGHILE